MYSKFAQGCFVRESAETLANLYYNHSYLYGNDYLCHGCQSLDEFVQSLTPDLIRAAQAIVYELQEKDANE